MKVICTDTAHYVSDGGIAVTRGSIYHVVETIKDPPPFSLVATRQFMQPAKGIWYRLLEVHGEHYSGRFLELPDDALLTEETIEETLLHNQN